MKRFASLIMVLGTVAMLSGCALKLGHDDEPTRLEWASVGTAYVAAPGIHVLGAENILKADVLSFKRGGEIVSLDVWPVLSLGVGLVGARVQVLPFEVGAGVIFYHPEAVEYTPVKEEAKAEVKTEVRVKD